MSEYHYHTSIDHIAITTVEVIVGITVLRLIAGWLAQQPGVVGQVGTTIGGIVTFGGKL